MDIKRNIMDDWLKWKPCPMKNLLIIRGAWQDRQDVDYAKVW